MNKKIVSALLFGSLLSGCVITEEKPKEFPLALDESVCRNFPGEHLNAYEFLYRVTNKDHILYHGRFVGLKDDLVNSPLSVENINKVPYLKEIVYTKNKDSVVKTKSIMGNVDTGFNLSISIDKEDQEIFNYSMSQSYLHEIRKIGKEDLYIEGPSLKEHAMDGSFLPAQKVDIHYGEFKKSELEMYFSNESYEKEDRPLRFELIACPINGTDENSLTIE